MISHVSMAKQSKAKQSKAKHDKAIQILRASQLGRITRSSVV
jgi:hypothetical protein